MAVTWKNDSFFLNEKDIKAEARAIRKKTLENNGLNCTVEATSARIPPLAATEAIPRWINDIFKPMTKFEACGAT